MSNREYDEIVCHCNVKENAELIAKIMDYDVESKVCTDVVEVKYGKWVNDKGLYKCSACNEFWSHWWAIVVGDERMNKMMKFCPKCGADMRKRREVK